MDNKKELIIPESEILNLEYHIRRMILKALNGYSFRLAAFKLGISVRTLYYKMHEYQIQKKDGVYVSERKDEISVTLVMVV